MKPLAILLCFTLCLYACSSPNKKTVARRLKTDTTAKPHAADTVFSGDTNMTVPPYGLEKVQALIGKITSVEDTNSDGRTEALDEKTYALLSFREKFTYHMINQEAYSQNCDILPERTDEVHRIYGHLPDIFGEYEWSDRQLDFFKTNRDSVETLMKLLIVETNGVGDNFKEAIVEMNGKEMIPSLIDSYNKERKDHYILTVLMLLMKQNEYPEFMGSTSFKKLYDRPSDEYSAYLTYNKANEDLIIQRATNFYNGLSKK